MEKSRWYRAVGWVVLLNLLGVAGVVWLARQQGATVSASMAEALLCLLMSVLYGCLAIVAARRRLGENCMVLAVALVMGNWLGLALLDWWLS
ncbi:hypothetical protein PQU95_11030 [Vogesella sp. DC21W]|uniref:Uncharacterized protein n=1 Tax=Vogesella aquatica TaxID=2984206 RepID=A0ABT5IYV1_9NEIS|nr:hypothetical protein [Vogesella aquatica]MDC7717744.1 hypothetical protein [Vogesella aquatica]